MRGRTYEQIVADRGPMGFRPLYRDPPEEPPCPCEDGEPCPVHDPAVAAELREVGAPSRDHADVPVDYADFAPATPVDPDEDLPF